MSLIHIHWSIEAQQGMGKPYVILKLVNMSFRCYFYLRTHMCKGIM